MSNAYLIEVDGTAAGIVVRDRRRFRFWAATHDFNDLEGKLFSNPHEAEKAAIRHAAGRPTRPRDRHGTHALRGIAVPS